MLSSCDPAPARPVVPVVSGPSPDEDRLLGALLELGHHSFRPGQREIIDTVVSGRHAVAIMPTGGGKSLCYQLPALLLQGVTLVVSPLIALMRDQVATLRRHGVAAAYINSTLSPAERDEVQQNLERYRLVYVAPERFKSPRFMEALSRVPLQLLAVDEAHCISEWGHDFRPDYSRLGEVVRVLRPQRLLALTATATPEVRGDIVKQLGMADPEVVVQGFDRPNLELAVEPAGGDRDKLARAVRLLAGTASGVAIVYTSTRKKAQAVAEGLARSGLLAKQYHAGLDDEERRQTEKLFLDGKLPVIVATNAFGMGIDKRDVRLVLHHDLPRSPEAYYQEMGRAGRDGKPARCVLLFNAGDARVQEFLIEQSAPDQQTIHKVYQRLWDRRPQSAEDLKGALYGINGMMVDATLRVLERCGMIEDPDGSGYMPTVPPRELRWDQQAIEERQERERQKLKRMLKYGYHTGCRMRFFLDYFGDHLREEEAGRPRGGGRCGRCNNCAQSAGAPLSDADQLVVRKALSGVARMDGRFGRRRVAEVLHGSLTQEVERARLSELSTFGILAAYSLDWLMDLLGRLEGAGLLVSSGGDYPTLSLLPSGREVMHDRARAQLVLPSLEQKAGKKEAARPRLRQPVQAQGAGGGGRQPQGGEAALPPPTSAKGTGRGARADATDEDLPLTPQQEARFERLRQMRAELAREGGLPPFVVFHDRTLRAIARVAPRDRAALGKIAGIGPAKLERYSQQVLAALQ